MHHCIEYTLAAIRGLVDDWLSIDWLLIGEKKDSNPLMATKVTCPFGHPTLSRCTSLWIWLGGHWFSYSIVSAVISRSHLRFIRLRSEFRSGTPDVHRPAYDITMAADDMAPNRGQTINNHHSNPTWQIGPHASYDATHKNDTWKMA